MLVKLLTAAAISFATTVAAGAVLLPFLRRVKAGQVIRPDGPSWHLTKAGTPTMGGLMFVLGTAVAIATAGYPELRRGEYGHIYMFAFAFIFGVIGFADDLLGLLKKRNLGLTAKMKFLLQLVVAVAFIALLRRYGYLTPNLYVPFFNVIVSLPVSAYFVFAAFVIVGTVNAVNLTDGVDGLATGTTIPVVVCLAVIAYHWGEQFLSIGIYSAAVIGALFGFLVYNFNPAKIFMGDTGSLFLGGSVCALAFALDIPLILATLGVIYIVEALSVIIQVTYFKRSGGKRVFQMSPFHHHLEMGGWSGKKWSEKELFALFTTISALFAVISFVGVAGRH